MHEAIHAMLDGYECNNLQDHLNALRDILQRLALLGLWRSKFFEHAAFYGGTALRMMYGLDRFSEDLDFSLLAADTSFSMVGYEASLRREIESYGFNVEYESCPSRNESPVESAFLKADTYNQLIVIEAGSEILRGVHPGKLLKIKLEVDTEPPEGFKTETRYILRPIPIPVRAYVLPDMLAGKLHAVLCRKWGKRVKGRDWYDMLWYAGNHPEVHLSHLETRMRQSGDYIDEDRMTISKLRIMLEKAINDLNIDAAHQEVSRFLREQGVLDIWSADLFRSAVECIVPV